MTLPTDLGYANTVARVLQEALIRPGGVASRVACAAGTSPPPRALGGSLARTNHDAPD